ncbi:MAG: hypothetical protein WA654_11865, partial [Candidatus Sulfotelmatobacter sp.]
MKLTTGILAVVMMTGAAWGQNPGAIANTRSEAKSLPPTQTKTNNPQPVLVAQAAKPTPGAPTPAVKPATIPGAA